MAKRKTAEQRDAFALAQLTHAPSMLGTGRAGVPVTPGTALGIAAFAQGTKLISENIGKTELFPARRHERGGYTPAVDHPTYDLLRHAPNSYQSSFSFWSSLITHAVVAGMGLGEIRRTRGRVTGLHLLDPSLKPEVRGDRIVYKGGGLEIDGADVICIRGISWDGMAAFSPVNLARDMLGSQLAMTQYQASLLGNGAQAGGHLEIPGSTTEQQRANIREGWNAIHQGPANAGKVGMLWAGTKWVQTSYSPSDAQLVEGQNFGVAEVSRLLNIPGWMLGVPDAIKPSSTEEGMALFVALTLSAWFRQIQQELDLKLLTPAERRNLFFWHDTRTLTQGDSRSQVEEADKLIKIGVYSVNEGRLSIGMNPIDDERFDWHLIPVNNLRALETIDPDNPAPTQPAVNEPMPKAAGGDDGALRAMATILDDAIARFARNEAEAVRRAAGKPRLDRWAEDFYPKHASKLGDALAPIVEASNTILGTNLDARAIARDIADESLADLRSLWTTLAPEEIAPKLDPILARWEARSSLPLLAQLKATP